MRAAFDLYYASNDSVRQALSAEFANQMKELGIEVSIKGASWDDIYPHQYSDPICGVGVLMLPLRRYELNYSHWLGQLCML